MYVDIHFGFNSNRIYGNYICIYIVYVMFLVIHVIDNT